MALSCIISKTKRYWSKITLFSYPLAFCTPLCAFHQLNKVFLYLNSAFQNGAVLPPGEFTVMIPELHATLEGAAIWRIQWHVIPEPRVTLQGRLLPLGEFTVMIPEPHATLQGAVTWWNQCHDCAISQGVRIPSAILKIVFRHMLFFCFQCSLSFDERRLSYRFRYTCLVLVGLKKLIGENIGLSMAGALTHARMGGWQGCGQSHKAHTTMRSKLFIKIDFFCRAMLCISAAYALIWCLSVCLCVCPLRS